jgi:hypothetical protein
MRIAVLLAAASVIFSSIPLLAQQFGVGAQQGAASAIAMTGTNSTLKTTSSTTTSSSTAAKAERITTVSGELEGKLDAKTARVGETVVLKTTGQVTTADGTVIPKGTRLIGHVTEAQAHDSSHSDSQLGIAFDRAALKNGQSLSIDSTIESVNPRPEMMASTLMNDDDSLGAPEAAGSRGGGRAAGSGRVSGGGLVSSSADRVDVTQGSLGEHMDSSASGAVYTPQSLTRATGHAAGNATANTAAAVHSVAAGGHASASNSNRVITRSTGIQGVMLRTGDSASASGTLSASKKNVHLDSGTQMDLSFAAAGK